MQHISLLKFLSQILRVLSRLQFPLTKKNDKYSLICAYFFGLEISNNLKGTLYRVTNVNAPVGSSCTSSSRRPRALSQSRLGQEG